MKMMEIANSNIKESTVFIIGIFGILWNKFERLLGRNCRESNISDNLHKIMPRYNEESILNLHAVVLQRIASLRQTTNDYVMNKLCVGKNTSDKTNQPLVKNFIDRYYDLTREQKLQSAVVITYRIRCNMFHGEKDTNATDITSLDNQFVLFQTINSFLEKLV